MAAQGTGAGQAAGAGHGASAAAAKAAGSAAASSGVARGKYLVIAMGCDDCHTPTKMGADGPEPDMSLAVGPPGQHDPAAPATDERALGVRGDRLPFTAWAGPWGISYTRNLTPDKETGLG